MASAFPVNRVQDIIKRMDENTNQAEAIKTCFGILAIMSRDESNKLLIARDGMETILNSMNMHVDKNDVQESGCDLLWSLAFNNSAVKDYIAKHGGANVVVRAMKRHSRYADFLKSACGALSNMCQCKQNQEAVAGQGGLQPLVGSIHAHHTNVKLLPFIFDALASLIVGNEENARTVSSLGLIPLIISSLGRHKHSLDVIKSGCHTLAILTDVKSQASKIALAGGVPSILALLDAHPSYADLHRVAAVVLLRMLQESTHVAREITCNEGVRVLLKSIEKGGAQQDTVAAVTHILFSVTNPASPAASAIESQLWLPSKSLVVTDVKNGELKLANSLGASEFLVSLGGKQFARPSGVNADFLPSASTALSPTASSAVAGAAGVASAAASSSAAVFNNPSVSPVTALTGVVKMLGQYSERKDVVRAACRLLNNLGGYPGVIHALEKLNILDKILECVSIHTETKDVIDSAALMLKSIHRICTPTIRSSKVSCVRGLLHVYRNKMSDEEAIAACADALAKRVECILKGERNRELEEFRTSGGKTWEYEAIFHTIKAFERIAGVESSGSGGENSARKLSWSKLTPRVVGSLLNLTEAVLWTTRLANDPLIYTEMNSALRSLIEAVPPKHMDITRRVEKLLPFMSPPPAAAEKEEVTARDRTNSTGLDNNSSNSNKGEQESLDGFCVHGGSNSGKLSLNRPGPMRQQQQAVSPMSGERSPSIQVIGERRESSFRMKMLSDGNTNPRQGDSDRNSNSPLESLTSNPGFRTYTGCQTNEIGTIISSISGAGGVNSASNASSIAVVLEGPDPLFPGKRIFCMFPKHPQKYYRQRGASLPPALLDRCPDYLERLLTPSNPLSRFLAPGGGSTGNGGFESERMHLVYEGGSAAGRNLVSRCVIAHPYNIPSDGIGEKFEHSLTFDSEFESGNLHRVVQRGDAVYDLFLRSDLHTAGHTQWFYFAVSNTHPAALVKLAEQGVQVPPVRVRFNIVNLTKPDSLFNLGMRPVVYSCLDAVSEGIGWMRAGADISYYANNYQRANTAGEGVSCYYTLSFTIEFKNPKDTVLIAYSYPYTMMDYRAHLAQILERPNINGMLRQTQLCTTLGGECCDLLIITDFADKNERDRIGPILTTCFDSNGNLIDGSFAVNGATAGGVAGSSGRKGGKNKDSGNRPLKPAIFLSGRVHPGETPASWMMKGILEFLTSSSPAAQLLRQEFVIFIVPMLNPDGVIYGNNRCSLAGVDLNRQWKTPVKSLHPTVYFLKNFMLAQRKLRDVAFYVDLHGHSRKYNVFMYGCEDKKKPKPQSRAFPKFLSCHEIGQKYVSFADCSFHVKKGRESTARVVVMKELNIPCSYTLEATFCGSNYGPLKHCHMNIIHLQEVGVALCDSMLNFMISEGALRDAVMPSNSLLSVDDESVRAARAKNRVQGLTMESRQGINNNNNTSGHRDSNSNRASPVPPVEEKDRRQSKDSDSDVVVIDAASKRQPGASSRVSNTGSSNTGRGGGDSGRNADSSDVDSGSEDEEDEDGANDGGGTAIVSGGIADENNSVLVDASELDRKNSITAFQSTEASSLSSISTPVVPSALQRRPRSNDDRMAFKLSPNESVGEYSSGGLSPHVKHRECAMPPLMFPANRSSTAVPIESDSVSLPSRISGSTPSNFHSMMLPPAGTSPSANVNAFSPNHRSNSNSSSPRANSNNVGVSSSGTGGIVVIGSGAAHHSALPIKDSIEFLRTKDDSTKLMNGIASTENNVTGRRSADISSSATAKSDLGSSPVKMKKKGGKTRRKSTKSRNKESSAALDSLDRVASLCAEEDSEDNISVDISECAGNEKRPFHSPNGSISSTGFSMNHNNSSNSNNTGSGNLPGSMVVSRILTASGGAVVNVHSSSGLTTDYDLAVGARASFTSSASFRKPGTASSAISSANSGGSGNISSLNGGAVSSLTVTNRLSQSLEFTSSSTTAHGDSSASIFSRVVTESMTSNAKDDASLPQVLLGNTKPR